MSDSRVADELPALLNAVRTAIERTPLEVASVHAALEAILTFLTSPTGRTDANCTAADEYFRLQDDWSRASEELPEPYDAIVADIGGQLHDSLTAPAVARNFESTPEQLLARLQGIGTERSGT